MRQQEIVDEVLAHARAGDKILIGQTHTGSGKIKIKCGLFNMQTKRYTLSARALQRVRDGLHTHMN